MYIKVLVELSAFNIDKTFTYHVNEELTPIREKRLELAKNMDYVDEVLKEGTEKAREVAKENIKKFKAAIGINYFE